MQRYESRSIDKRKLRKLEEKKEDENLFFFVNTLFLNTELIIYYHITFFNIQEK